MLSNQDLNSIYRWLSPAMHGEDARTRNNFVKATESKKQIIDIKRTTILESFSEKDKDGKAIIENGSFKIKEGKMDECAKELADYFEQDSDISIDKCRGIALVLEKNMRASMTIVEAQEYYKVIDLLEGK